MYDKEIIIRTDKVLGYQYFLDGGHPLSNKNKKVYYHRHVASLKIGRWLTKKEHVHHIDGIRNNNTPENLAILTASEHAKTHQHRPSIPEKKPCQTCGNATINKKYCTNKCAGQARKKCRITKEKLHILIWQMPMTKVAELCGITDKGVAKICKRLQITIPPRGYWLRGKK